MTERSHPGTRTSADPRGPDHPSLAHASLTAAAGSHSTGSEDAILRGGPRDGLHTSVSPALTTLLSPSEAPGLLDVYERTGEHDGEVPIFRYTAQRTAEGVDPSLLHMPPAH